ncbi:MAG: GspE/PulE family protein, partial [Desulfuromonadales bacterium]
MKMQFEHLKIGDILVRMGALAPAEVRLILDQQSQSGKRFGETAVDHGQLSDELVAQALAQQFGFEYVDLDAVVLDPELSANLPAELPSRYNFIPLQKTDDGLVVAISDPTNVAQLDDLEMLLDMQLVCQIASGSKITALLEKTRGSKQVLQEVSEDFKLQLVKETDKGEEVLSIEKLTDDGSPIIRLIDSTLFDALNKRASDIHIESSPDGVQIKYRVDGVLFRATEPLDGRFQSPIISRIKVMSELDIS